MLHEYAIDPAVLSNWQSFRYFIDQCGVSYGRMIVCFPASWIDDVGKACAGSVCSQGERKRIQERLVRMGNRLVPIKRHYDNHLSWLENVVDGDRAKPFHAVISTCKPDNLDNVLIANEVHEKTKLWQVLREVTIPRTAEALVQAVRPMLLTCRRRVMFVDPYFDPDIRRFLKPLARFMNILKGNPNASPEYHLLDQKRFNSYECKFDPVKFEQDCRRRLTGIVPPNKSLRIVRWKRRPGGESFHARYILTDIGGIRVDYGLDEGKDGETTDVGLLDDDLYEKRWKNYHREVEWQKKQRKGDPVDDPDVEAYEYLGEVLVTAKQRR